MKTYNKEVLRYNKNSNEPIYICSVCKLEYDYGTHIDKQQFVMKDHFKLKHHRDNFNKKYLLRLTNLLEVNLWI